MSYKGPIEDKAVDTPLPRELTTLIEVTGELQQAVALKARDRAARLIEQVQDGWQRVNTLQLKTSAEGGNMPLLVSCAEALNEAQRVRATALSLVNNLGSTR